MIKILLIIDYSTEFSRRLLNGLIQYSKLNGHWLFYRLPSYYKTLYGKKGIINRAKEWNADGIIAEWDHEEPNLLKELNIPVILQNYKNRSTHFSNLTGDYIETGKMAARYFWKKRFSNFAFYGNKGVVWSNERAEGYKQEIERLGANYYYFETENLSGKQWSVAHEELGKWLLSLPKPAALFACDDNAALQVSEVCKINRIQIPKEVALLGVDNDELICNLSDPPISSIVLDIEKGGYQAGRLMHKLIKGEANISEDIVIKPIRLELRASTEKYNIGNEYILEVVNHIEKNFTFNITINSLISLVPLSRRNLEVKFKKEMGISVYQFILSLRTDKLAHLLATTNNSLYTLALECGFSDYRNISRIFKKFKGFTPLEYRQYTQNMASNPQKNLQEE